MADHPPERRGPTSRLGPFFLPAFLLISSCTPPDFLQDGTERAHRFAQANGWTYREFRTSTFTLAGFHRGFREETSDELVVYIEGDGQPWATPYRVSSDPTPPAPILLPIATADPAPRVLYLARPCQYTGPAAPGCRPEYWTSHRYSETVLRAIEEAIDQAVATTRSRRISLVGYSGGGQIAIILAARRRIASVITVAANLDHAAWTRLHGDTPLDGSLNAADFAASVASVPQAHLVGGGDKLVPPEIVQSYLRRMPHPSPVYFKIIPSYDHECCWVETWPALLSEVRSWLRSRGEADSRSGLRGALSPPL